MYWISELKMGKTISIEYREDVRPVHVTAENDEQKKKEKGKIVNHR